MITSIAGVTQKLSMSVRLLDTDHDGVLSSAEKERSTIIIYGIVGVLRRQSHSPVSWGRWIFRWRSPSR